MMHEETIRIIPNADTAVLLIHGICGSPNHFRQVLPIEHQIPAHWSVHNMVLDGHCKTVKDFGHSSMKKWRQQAETAFCKLAESHRRVIVVGHSMGTLFAMELAKCYPGKIPFLFLLASPVRVSVKPRAVKYLLQIAFDHKDDSDPILVSMRNACGIRQTKLLWEYVPWAPRMVELLQRCSQTSKLVGNIAVPCIALQSDHDEMVSHHADKLLEESGRVEVIHLRNSTHFYYAPEDAQIILDRFQKACEQYL